MLDHALLAAILEDPAADLPRLIAADWLDENGEPERAEFVRVQVELAAKHVLNKRDRRCQCGLDERDIYIEMGPHATSALPCVQLRRRERELLYSPCGKELNIRIWLGSFLDLIDKGARYEDRATFRRGFLHTIRCSAAEWLRQVNPPMNRVTIGQQILRQHPIERVEFTDGTHLLIGPQDHRWYLQLFSSRFEGGGQSRVFDSRAALIDGMAQLLRAWGVGRTNFQGMGVREYIGGVEVTHV